MRQLFLKNFWCFSKSYHKYANKHIIQSLQKVSTDGKISAKQVCQKYFTKTINKYQSIQSTQVLNNNRNPTISPIYLQNQLNIIFSACFQLQQFPQQRQIICQMILNQQLTQQSQIDRLIRWIGKEIKFNSQLGQKVIRDFLLDAKIKERQFLREIDSIPQEMGLSCGKESGGGNINMLCKQYRQKYPQVDSKLIYLTVKQKLQKQAHPPNNHEISLQGKAIKTNTDIKETKNATKIEIPTQNTPNINISGKQNKFWDKIQNIKPRLLKIQLNSPQRYQQHKKITENKLRFRFPPQPNGYLHIGHIKSIRMNFQSAKRLSGLCYLRYDDTNPENQTHQYIQEIQKNIQWMGYKPDKVNFTSDYFDQMIHYANQLVKNDLAYVCQSSQEQIQLQRKLKHQNPYRARPKSQSLRVFPNFLQPNQTLRLKLNPTSPNPTLRDPIIYRHKSHPHPRSGNKYHIYPMYDFAHCISDSIEHIDYSLCSLEFQVRRQLYYTILDMLGLWKPIVWEFSRLNIKGSVISKRKIKALIQKGLIEGWDDPRLLTIKGMQRRGFTPQMLNNFIDKVNASRSGNEKFVMYSVLDKEMKKQLTKQAKKLMAIREPYQVQLARDGLKELQQSVYSEQLSKSDHIYLEASEIQKHLSRQVNHKDSTVLILKHIGVFQLKKINNFKYLLVKTQTKIQQAKKANPKIPILSWVPEKHQSINTDLFSPIIDENQQFNPQSKQNQNFIVWPGIITNNLDDAYLFERNGYFKRDPKNPEKLLCCTQL